MSDEKDMQEVADQVLTDPSNALGIAGLEGVDPSIIPIPYVRLVQPGSKNITLADGKDAEVGSYYFSDTQSHYNPLKFVILKAKHGEKTFPDPNNQGQYVTKKVLAILGAVPETEKVFLLTLSVMSFTGFGKLVALLKEKKITNVSEYIVSASSHKVENDKGKFYVSDFQLDEKLDGEQFAKMGELFNQYGSVVEKKSFDDNEDGVVVQPQPPVRQAVTPLPSTTSAVQEADLSSESQVDASDIPF